MNRKSSTASRVTATAATLAICAVAPSFALAASPSAPVTLNASAKSADSQSVGMASSGAKTVVWKQTQGPYASPTGNDVRATRITVRTRIVTIGSGRNRRKVKKSQTVVTPLRVYSATGRFIPEVVSATTPSGVTTIAWGLRDRTGNKVSLMARRITAAGRLGPVITVSPAGKRAHDLRIASATSSAATLLWTSDDSFVSWVEAKRIGSTGTVGNLISVTPNHGAYHDVVMAGRPDGSADVVWRNGNGAQPITELVQITAGGLTKDAVELGDPANSSNDDQAIAMGANGRSTIAWSESVYDPVSKTYSMLLRMTRVDAAGNRGRTVNITSADSPYQPAIGVAANGTSTIAWGYDTGGMTRVRMARISANYAKSSILDLGPVGERLVSGFGPTVAVAPNGLATFAWSVVKAGGFPQAVYLQSLRVDASGHKGSTVKLVAPNSENPDLVHFPVLASGPDGTCLVAFVRRSVYGSSASLKLISWK